MKNLMESFVFSVVCVIVSGGLIIAGVQSLHYWYIAGVFTSFAFDVAKEAIANG